MNAFSPPRLILTSLVATFSRHSGARVQLARHESVLTSRGYGFRTLTLRAISGMTLESVGNGNPHEALYDPR
jgi:hypothetical protein